MLQLIKASLPGSIPFLIVAIVIGMVLLWRPRYQVVGRNWLLTIFVIYTVFSIPASARLFAVPLAWGFPPLVSLDNTRNAQAIVVLDGGTGRFSNWDHLIEIPFSTSVLRALEAIRIYWLLDRPIVFVSGGDKLSDPSWGAEGSVVRDLLLKGGVPAERIVLDSSSVNTRAHAINLVRMLREREIEEFVLVTSPSHMRRAVWAFQAEGAHPISSVSKGVLDNLHGWKVWLPSTAALEFTQATMHEYLGIVYYFFRGYV